MSRMNDRKILIMATHGFEKSELFQPKSLLEDAGAEIKIASPEQGEIKSWDEDNWGEAIAVDMRLEDVNADDFDALVLPGGQINPDILRTKETAVQIVRAFHLAGKPVAAICHAPWMLAEAGLLQDTKATSYPSIRTDVENAGAAWEDSEVVVDKGLITSRNPGDIEAFTNAVMDAVESAETTSKAA